MVSQGKAQVDDLRLDNLNAGVEDTTRIAVIMSAFGKLNRTTAPNSVVLIRFIVGLVFLAEGILKFLYPDELGAGRFAKIGIPYPQTMGPFVGGVEILCGALLIVGLLTRLAAIALLIDISVAIISTKIPVLLGHGVWHFSGPKALHYGLLGMLHEARTDLAMLFGLLFLLSVGAGKLSLDARAGGGKGSGSKGSGESKDKSG